MSLTSYRAAPPRVIFERPGLWRLTVWSCLARNLCLPVLEGFAFCGSTFLFCRSSAFGLRFGGGCSCPALWFGLWQQKSRPDGGFVSAVAVYCFEKISKLCFARPTGRRPLSGGPSGAKRSKIATASGQSHAAFGRPGSDLLSRVLRQSTISAGAFHGRVRNGNGC